MARVRLEPIGDQIECAGTETILDAAFRQGFNLAHGCREGQCSACKCYLLEGDVALERYSSFALSDAERAAGYALMCRAVPESDVVVELLHVDPDDYRLAHAIRDGEATVTAVTELTHDITGVTLAVTGLQWVPGQYLDIHVPGEDGARRSFSIANLPGEDRVELMIKRYPGGRLSGMLGAQIVAGTRLTYTGPYGAFHRRESARPILMIAGGSGMAPVLAVLRELAAERCARPVRFYYGAREPRDLFMLAEIAALGERLADFTFIAVTGRHVHEAVAVDGGPDVYMCGPPPMIDACALLLAERGVDPDRIFTDRFTTAAEAVTAPAYTRSEREFAWFAPAGRRATLYEDVTIDTQPSVHRHLRRGWPLSFADGRGTWDDASTALRCADWFAFRDPGEQWERPFYQDAAAAERQLDGALRTAAAQGLLADLAPDWIEFLRDQLQVPAFVEHGLWFALATVARDCLSDSVATCVCLQAAHKQRSAQAIVLYAMDLEPHLAGELPIAGARATFLADPAWQPTRRYLERLAATPDWGEVVIAANLCFEPTVATLIRRELGTRAAAAHGDIVTPVLARIATQEWDWARAWTAALVRLLVADPEHGAHNRSLIGGWVRDWLAQARDAAAALAPVGAAVGVDAAIAAQRTRADAGALLADAGVGELGALVGHRAAKESAAPASPARSRRPGTIASARQPSPASPDSAGDDVVGIVMARSAEGDAVARYFAGRERVQVIEQPAFWEIRARDRLVIPYDQISEELGYAIDSYSIQHEMSTHYGRMVAGDDSLMLFSDPTDAMEHLLS
ncbi:MAG: MmoB/DmpM family protein [Solirubrobacteraceae bacterium]|jgi:NAD(P)H-flavin reductase/ferredoxin